MVWPGIYAFDAADEQLSLLPMAARRALDLAGVHLSLSEWQRMSLGMRRELITLGAGSVVDDDRVQACLREAGAAPRVQERSCDPSRAVPPRELFSLAGFDAACWPHLRPLDRYVLAHLARRGKWERLVVAHAEIVAALGKK